MYNGTLASPVDQLGQLPGISPKSAQRMAIHVLNAKPENIAHPVDATNAAHGRVRHCGICGNLAKEDECSIRRNVHRNLSVICIVQEPKDIQATEGTHVSRGRYHVPNGVIDPIRGVGPDQLNIASLTSHLAGGTVIEVTLTTSSGVEDETTTAYLARMFSITGIEASRLAMGLSMSDDLEYTDSVTLGRVLEGCRCL